MGGSGQESLGESLALHTHTVYSLRTQKGQITGENDTLLHKKSPQSF